MKKKLWIALVLALLLVLVPAAAAVGIFSHYTGKLNYQTRGEESAAFTATPLPEDVVVTEMPEPTQGVPEAESREDTGKDVTNIMLIGVDNDYAGGMDSLGNADGLILLSINEETRQMVLTSFMRDIYVPVPGKGYNTKLTLSYHYGGTEALLDTIEQNFGVPIDSYVLVNYLNVIEIVDAVGGLPLEVDRSELYYMQDKIRNLNRLRGMPEESDVLSPEQEGELTLNGVQTAAYMRIRLAGNGDYERTERARRVLLGLKDKALDMGISELNRMANTVLPNITTDLEQGEIFSLLLNAPSYLKYDIRSQRIPVEGSFYAADIVGSCIVVDFPVNSEYLRKSIYEGKTE